MSERIMLQAKLIDIPLCSNYESEFEIRECNLHDIDSIGKLYFHSYDAGQACESEEGSILDIKNSFEGEYGLFWPQVSMVALDNNKIIGSIMVVHKNSWDKKIDCPYIIELFVHRDYRKKGVAKSLILSSCEAIKKSGQHEVALTVVENNTIARNLYCSIGFKEYIC